jgi:hypothetical protein
MLKGNVSSENRPLRANYGNFNLSQTMLIQRRAHGRWEGWFAKVHLQIIPSTSHEFCTWPLPPSISLPLDQHHVVQIEVSIVCTEGLVSIWYVPKFYLSFYTSFCLSFPIHFIFILSLLFYLFIWFIPTHFLFSLFSHVFIFFNT